MEIAYLKEATWFAIANLLLLVLRLPFTRSPKFRMGMFASGSLVFVVGMAMCNIGLSIFLYYADRTTALDHGTYNFILPMLGGMGFGLYVMLYPLCGATLFLSWALNDNSDGPWSIIP